MTQYSKGSNNPKTSETHKALLTIREACRLLNVHSNTLRRWTATGLINAYRVGPGSHRRYRQEDIVALLTDQTTYRQINNRK